MGHSDYQTTMDIYTDITDEKKQADFEEIDGRMRLVVMGFERGVFDFLKGVSPRLRACA